MGAIASLFATIGIDTSSLDKGLGGSKSQLSGFSKELVKSTIGTLSLATATYKAGKAVIDSIRDWADYADSMRLSAQMAGVTTEEMSRLTQAADDFRVPMETMQRSMEMALKNGFTPTIDNLAALSDELLAIQDPTVRAAKASEIFGKSYADMMPFLLAGGDAIRAGTAAIDDNLIVTEDGAQAAKDYKDALDDLGDTWTGLKNVLGQALVPVATNMFTSLTEDIQDFVIQMQYLGTVMDYWGTKPFNTENLEGFIEDLGLLFAADMGSPDFMNNIQWQMARMNEELALTPGVASAAAGGLEQVGNAAEDTAQSEISLVQSIFDATDSWGEFEYRMAMANLPLGMMNEELYNSEKALAASGKAAVNAASDTGTLTEEELALIDATIEAAEAQAKMNAELENITSLEGNYEGIIDLAYDYTDMLEEITAQEKIMAEEPIGSEKYEEAKTKVEELKGSMKELADRVTLDMLQATIAVGGVTQAELGAYMQMAIDMGYMSEEGAKAAMAAYGNAIETINGLEIDEKTGNVTVDATAAFATFDLLEQYVLLDKEQRVFVRTYYETYGNYDPYENYTGPTYGEGTRASGGNVYTDTPYIVGERGPELFMPHESGQIISNDKLLALLGGNGKTGNTYNLIMPTTANPMDLKMAFELMEAWNG